MMLLLLAAVVWSAESRPAAGVKGGLVLPDGSLLAMNSRRTATGRELFVTATTDGGATWRERGAMTRDPSSHADLGDGNFVRLKDGTILGTFRRNHVRKGRYAIEVVQSTDGGKSWRPHSTVDTNHAQGEGPSRGFWAPTLFVTPKREIQCYYDNEALPFASGAPGHQWVTMRTWRDGAWSAPTVVAREPSGLSRDGMPTLAALKDGRLWCVVEAVRKEEPHAGVLRAFLSGDEGRTWGRPTTVYAPKDARFHAFCPSMVRVGGRLVLTFATNEDRAESPRSGTPADRMGLDIKSIESGDEGRTWSAPSLVYGGTHRSYLPSTAVLRDGTLLSTFVDFDRGDRSVAGRVR